MPGSGHQSPATLETLVALSLLRLGTDTAVARLFNDLSRGAADVAQDVPAIARRIISAFGAGHGGTIRGRTRQRAQGALATRTFARRRCHHGSRCRLSEPSHETSRIRQSRSGRSVAPTLQWTGGGRRRVAARDPDRSRRVAASKSGARNGRRHGRQWTGPWHRRRGPPWGPRCRWPDGRCSREWAGRGLSRGNTASS